MELLKEYLNYINNINVIDKYIENIKNKEHILINTHTKEDCIKLLKYLKVKHNKRFLNSAKEIFNIYLDETAIFIDKSKCLSYQSIDCLLNKEYYRNSIFMQYKDNTIIVYDGYEDMINKTKGR